MAEATNTKEKTAEPADSGRRDAQGRRIDTSGKPITETGAHDMALPATGERGGGAIAKELVPDPPADAVHDPLKLQHRYIKSRLAKEAGQIIGRAPENIGLFGKGDTYHGVGILVDVDSMEKVRVYDGWKFTDDRVFANSRDLPAALVDGSITQNLGG